MAFVIRNIMLSSQEAPSNQTKVSTPQDLRMLGHQSTLHSTQNRGHTIRFCVRRSTLEMAHIVSLESSRTPLQYSRITGYTPRCPRAVTFMRRIRLSSGIFTPVFAAELGGGLQGVWKVAVDSPAVVVSGDFAASECAV
ncbi:predicted protein [Histoplasma capsulatum G186AR]|uniref:Uncharacterized protein n=1 Tax=Ajellomyces capsulatus (strain G186AR / H82 / ATCC MYA-2454 / RMSCC 2432) TaxID=447093 RepID=C0NCY7_AJECG|nr:uncharacterized protein HCBG_00983 [Histoplasma capsulatum G186AR]EEH11528.1 predicted protein [Histoplasma capsulatum G186AR]